MATYGNVKIAIDPGHGGDQPGCTSGGFVEKDCTLELAHRLADAFAYVFDMGDVVLTRGLDEHRTLEQRAEFARAEAADLVVVLHFDSNTKPEVGDLATYYLPEDDIARVAAADIEHCAPQEVRPHLAQGCLALPNTWTQRAYNVLAHHKGMHPVLVEAAFLTCTRHQAFLRSPIAMGAIASGIATGMVPAIRMLEQRLRAAKV